MSGYGTERYRPGIYSASASASASATAAASASASAWSSSSSSIAIASNKYTSSSSVFCLSFFCLPAWPGLACFPSHHHAPAMAMAMPRRALFSPPPPAPRRPSSSSSYLPPLLISLPLLAASAFLLLFLLRRLRRSPKPLPPPSPPSLRRFSYRDLRLATNSFHPSLKLGKGGYGVVYRGLLPDGTEVAVKKMVLSSAQGEREFQNELSICKRLHSRYVVKLLGFSSHGDKVRLLVYECMKNRSLQEALLEKNAPVLLDWQMRFNIISDVARALAYLHVECSPPVIHGDVKPSNVLLDGGFRAYLADFGLARLKIGVDPEAAEKGRSDASEAEMGTPESSKVKVVAAMSVPDADQLSLPSSYLGSPHSALHLSTDIQPAESDIPVSTRPIPLRQTLALNHHQDAELKVASPAAPESRGSASADPSLSVPGSPNNMQEFPVTPPHCADSAAPPALPARRTAQKGVPGKYWWWKQEYSGELKVRDYVMEWMRSELSASETRSGGGGTTERAQEEEAAEEQRREAEERRRRTRMRRGKLKQEATCADEMMREEEEEGAEARRRRERRGANSSGGGSSSNSSGRKSREWWKDEYFAELSRKKKKRKKKGEETGRWVTAEGRGGGGGGRRRAAELAGEMTVASEDLSSTTTSMRGTVCYVAPEFGGGGTGAVSEASDIYSFGVLLLVIISGRRPIEIMSSSSAAVAATARRFERANLISWARNLASTGGNILDLVDERLQGAFEREQVQLCIALAMSCIRCLPASRPTITTVLRVLQGDAPVPPLDFSPSPPPPSRLSAASASPYYNHHQSHHHHPAASVVSSSAEDMAPA